MTADPKKLMEILDHRFARPALLVEALTHPSIAGRGRTRDYERLEFLGDRVLGLVIAEMLLNRFSDEVEGALARRLAALVKRETLVRVAGTIGLGRYLVLSKAEEDAGGRGSAAILADCCEAVIGALYVDGGLDPARAFVVKRWGALMEEAVTPPKDAKTGLQEWAQGRGKPLPMYETIAMHGPPHDPIFEVQVGVEGYEPVIARGPSKRVAEQAAASEMLQKVKE